MKKSTVNYNNIKLSVARSNEPRAESMPNKRIIFKSKPSKTNADDTDQKNTLASTNNPGKKTKIVLKRTLKEKTDQYNFDSSIDSDEDVFNVLDLNTKTSQLSIKKQKNDSSPSSSSTSSFSSSFQTTEVSPKCTKISPTNKTKNIELKSLDEDLEANSAKKIKVEKIDNKIFDLEAKLRQLDEDDDFDQDIEKIKKFKLIKKTVPETKTESNLETKSNLVIKNKIFSSKSRNDETGKNTKMSSFKLNFNENDEKSDTDEEIESDSGKKSLAKTNSLQPASHSGKLELIPRSQSFDPKMNAKDLDSTLIIVNIRNTRKAYECEELGEAQAFQDDFDYLLDGLNSKHKLSERCLSSIKLAECCQSSEFRMNLRSSMSSDGNNVHKIFKLLADANNYKSLSLCTALIVFTLTQDNLSIDIDDSTFNLILSFLHFNEKNNCMKDLDNEELDDKFSYLIDLTSNTCHMNNQKNVSQLNDEISSSDANDDLIVYKKIYSKCKKIYDHIHSDNFTKEYNMLHDIHFNCALLTLDCLLNMNQNMKKNIILNNFYKNEMREKFVIDKILIRSKLILNSLINLKTQSEFEFAHNELEKNTKFLFLLNKLKSCINLVETLTQPISHSKSANFGSANNLKSIKYKEEDGPLESNQLNQNYLMDLKNRFLIEFIKESLNFFNNQINMLLNDRTKFESSAETDQLKSKVLNYFVNALKEQFLFLISLTQNNEYVSKKLISDKEFVGVLFKFLINESKAQSILFKLPNENDQFDLLIMLLGILLNLFVNCFNDKVLLNLIKYKNKEASITALEIVLKLYQTKENLVRIAENDQENEFNQLNEHIESQNIENINVAIMNSIHKAGKHMEDHIIAAHSGLIIGYMLFIDDTFNKRNYIQIDSVQAKLKNKAFKSMVQIIRKFIIFMKMMKVSGFSADKYLEMVLEFLEHLEN